MVIVGHERSLEQRSAELELLHRRMSSLAMNADSLQIEVGGAVDPDRKSCRTN